MTIIGSAEVVIRAVTTGVNAEIQKALRDARKGVKDEGNAAGGDYASGFDDAISKALPNHVRNAMSGIDLSGHGSSAASSFNRGFGSRVRTDAARAGDDAGNAFTRGFQKRVDKASSGPGMFEKFFGGGFDSKIKSASEAMRGLYVNAALTGTKLVAAAGAVSSVAGSLGLLALGASAAAGSLVALPGLLAAVAQGGIVLSQAMKGVGKAITAGLNPEVDTRAAQAAAKANAKAVESAQKQIEAANDRIQKAHRGVQDAMERRADAEVDANRRSADAAEKAADAQRDLDDAQRDLTLTQQKLTDAQEAGAEALQQLGFRAEDAALNEQRAALRLQDAYEKLQTVQELPLDSRARIEAELAFKESELNYREAKDSAQDLAKEQEKAAEAGVDGTKEVVDAQNDILKAQEKVTSAAEKQADAQKNIGEVAEKNQRAIRDADQAVADANDNLAAANRALQEANDSLADINATAAEGTGVVNKFADAMAKLSPAAKDFVNKVVELAPKWKALRDSMGEPLFERLTPAFEKLTNLTSSLDAPLRNTAGIIGIAAEQVANLITEGEGLQSLTKFLDGNNEILGVFTDTIDGGKSGIQSLISLLLTLGNAIQPVTKRFAEWMDGFVKKLDTEGALAKFTDFFTKAGDAAADFGDVFRGLWDSFKTVLKVAMDGPIHDMLDMLADLTTQLSDVAAAGAESGKLKDYFKATTENLKPMLELLGQVALVFLEMGASPTTGKIAETLKEAIPYIKTILEAGLGAGPAFATLVVAVSKLLAAFAKSDALTVFFDTLTWIADLLTKIIDSDVGQMILGWLGPIHAVVAAVGLVVAAAMKFGPALLRPFTMLLGLGAKVKGMFGGGAAAAASAGASGAGSGGGARGGDGGDGGDGGRGGDGGSCECDGKKGHGGGPECVECGSGGGRATGSGTSARTRRGMAGGGRASGGSGGSSSSSGGSRSNLEDVLDDDDDERRVPRPSSGAREAAASTGRRGTAGNALEDVGEGAEKAAKGTSMFGKAMGFLGGAFKLVLGLLPILIPIFQMLYEKNESFRNTIDSLMKVLSGLADTLMTALMPVFEALMPVITNLFDVLGPVLTNLVAAIVPVITDLANVFTTKLIPVIMDMVPVIGKIFTTIGTIISNLVPIVVPIITEIVGIFTDVLLPAIIEILPVVAMVFETVGDLIAQLVPVVIPVIQQLVQTFVGVLVPVIKALMPVFTTVIKTIITLISQLIPVIIPVITGLVEAFTGVLIPVINSLMPIFTQVIGVVLTMIQKLIPIIVPIIMKLVTLFVETLIPVINSLMPVFMMVINVILNVIQTLLPVILPIIMQLVEIFVGVLIPVVESLMPVFTQVIGLILTLIETLVPVILPIIMQLVNLFLSVFMPVIQALLPLFTKVFGFIMEIIGKLVPFITPIITTIVNLFEDIFVPVIESLGPIVETIFSGIQTVIEGVFKGISTAYDTVIKPVWKAFQDALDWLGRAFDSVSAWISNAWFNVQTGMITALNWIIGAINWLIDGLNWIITKFGMDAIPKVQSATLPQPVKSSGATGGGSPSGGSAPFATGGYVSGPGGPTDDKINARLSNGEYVLRASTVKKIGKRRLDELNISGNQMALLGGFIAGNMSQQPQQQAQGVFDWVSDTFGDAVNWVGDKASDAVGFVGSLMKEGIGNGLAKLLETFSEDYLTKPEAGWFGTLLQGWVKSITESLRKWGQTKDEEEKKKFDEKQAAQALGSNGMWGPGIPYTTGKFAVNTEAARQFIASDLGMPLGDLGGLYGGSVPGSDHAMGKAIDAMVKGWNTPAGIAVGDKVAKWFLDNPNEFGTKYVIWRKQYAEPGKGWTPYSHPGGSNPTLDHYDHVHLSFLTGPGEFVRGGGVNSSAVAGGDPKNLEGPPPGAPPGAGATRNQNTVDPIIPHGAMNMDRGSMANVGPLPPGGAVERWRNLYAYALQLEGQSTAYLGAMMNQMRTESTGNPLAYNGYDRNAVNGYPSKGLLQTIPQTFRSFARPGYSTNIWDPLSNALASIRYVLKRYGSLAAGYRGVAYDTGGIMRHGSVGINLSGKPERVLSPTQTQSFDKLVDAITASNGMSTGGWSNSDSGALSSRDMSLITTVANAVAARQGDTHVRVFIGERELTDIVDTQVGVYDYATARTIQLGRKP